MAALRQFPFGPALPGTTARQTLAIETESRRSVSVPPETVGDERNGFRPTPAVQSKLLPATGQLFRNFQSRRNKRRDPRIESSAFTCANCRFAAGFVAANIGTDGYVAGLFVAGLFVAVPFLAVGLVGAGFLTDRRRPAYGHRTTLFTWLNTLRQPLAVILERQSVAEA